MAKVVWTKHRKAIELKGGGIASLLRQGRARQPCLWKGSYSFFLTKRTLPPLELLVVTLPTPPQAMRQKIKRRLTAA